LPLLEEVARQQSGAMAELVAKAKAAEAYWPQ
jgi:hypothetical protein